MTFKVAVVGATGAVGRELLSIFESRKFPISELVVFGSELSVGKRLQFKGRELICKKLESGCFESVQIAFFDASDEVSKKWVPEACAAGAWVIDNSATFRLEDEFVLGVPEVNSDTIRRTIHRGLSHPSLSSRVLSGPNCVAVPAAVVLSALQKVAPLKRVVISTYQSTSGAGGKAQKELLDQSRNFLENRAIETTYFARPIPFNCIPHIGRFLEDGTTSEENKIILETQKLLALPSLPVSVTSVRVPTLVGHALSMNVEFESPTELSQVRNALKAQAGLELRDANDSYPTHLDAAGGDLVLVGRVRQDPSVESGINLWVVSDNLRKGAALNAAQLGEILLEVLERH